MKQLNKSALLGFAIGVAIEAPALFAAVMSAGAGHGSYFAARALFPFSMLLTLLEGFIGPIAVAVALLQFPLYGALIGWGASSMRLPTLCWLAAAHLAAAAACLSGLLPAFS